MLQVFLGDLMYAGDGVGNRATPINIGFIGGYLEAALGSKVEIELFKEPSVLLQAAKKSPPDILALSSYPWNHQLSLALFREFKSQNPNIITVMGGPNYPGEPFRQQSFLAERPFLDFYTFLEGEIGFVNLLSRILDVGTDLAAIRQDPIPSIHFLDDTGTLVRGPMIDRIVDLDSIPSPYLNGSMDPFLEMGIRPTLQTNRGCPFTCTFCVEGSDYHLKVRRFSQQRISDELTYIAERVNTEVPLSITDSNFGMYKQDVETCQVIRDLQDSHGWPNDIILTTGKNQQERIIECVKLTRGAFPVDLNLQSLHAPVLENIRRKNISVDALVAASSEARSISKTARSTAALIMSMPGETLETHVASLRELVDMEIDLIEVNQLLLLAGSEMDTKEYRDKFNMETRFRAVNNHFGEFGPVSAIEVEEVCVATDIFSYEDYLEARNFLFFLGCYYVDHNMIELRKYLQSHGIHVFDWIKKMRETADQAPEAFQQVFEDFKAATRGELLETRDDVIRLWNDSEGRRGYIHGELGDNKFFKYRAKAITTGFKALVEFGSLVAQNMILEANPDANKSEISGELAEISRFMEMRRRIPYNTKDLDQVYETDFEHDFIAWEKTEFKQGFRNFKSSAPKKIRFSYSDSQRKKLALLYANEGASLVGLSMILRKANPLTLNRQVELHA